MPKFSSFSRFLVQITLSIIAVAVVLFALSSYLFSDVYTASQYSALSEALRSAQRLLAEYRAGGMDLNELRRAVNPALSTDFYMLLDENRQVLAYTQGAAPYFAGGTLTALLEAAEADTTAGRSMEMLRQLATQAKRSV